MANPWMYLRDIAQQFYEGELRAPHIRFNLGFLKGSEIKQQFYCEQQLHFKYSRGDVDLESRQSSARRIVSMILVESRKPVRYGWIRTPLIYSLEGVPIITTPDAILVREDEILLIVKASTSRYSRLSLGDEALARLQLYILDLLGFKVSNTKYYIIKGNRSELIEALLYVKNKQTPPENIRTHILVHDEERARGLISWALAYWTFKRDPKPNPSAGKCNKCPYRSVCPVRNTLYSK